MTIGPVALHCSGTRRVAWLRRLNGHDEEAVDGTGTADALALLDRVLVDAQGEPDPGAVVQMPAADRDLLLAAVYVDTYGPGIASTVTCRRCGEPFDVRFSLPDMVRAVDDERAITDAAERSDPPGLVRTSDGRVFRVPTGVDELGVAGLDADAAVSTLLQRCAVEGDPTADPERVERAMRQLAPLLDREIEIGCPECGASQQVRFELQGYLLRALLQERAVRTREIHRLALAYGWRLDEILSLPRRTRQRYAALVEAEPVAPVSPRRSA